MFDIGSVSAAIGSVKTAIDIAKVLKDNSDIYENAEVKLQLANLISALADAKMEIAEVQELLINSEKEKKELQDQIALKESLLFEPPYYWRILENDDREGPYCQVCYDKEKKLIRLQDEKQGQWRCLSCKEFFTDKNYQEYTGDFRTEYQAPFV